MPMFDSIPVSGGLRQRAPSTTWLRGFAARLRGVAAVITVACAAAVMAPAHANEGGYPLDTFPAYKLNDQAALQDGATTFVNYCLNCHSANSMRYNRMKDIGLTDDQIKKNLLFVGDKVGEPMRIAMRPADAKTWFGAMPPDLSVEARARASTVGSGPDWLYTYLRAFYRDSTRPTGWNNALFPNVGMPHVLWNLEGSRGVTIVEDKAAAEAAHDEAGKAAGGHAAGGTRTTIGFDPATGLRTETKAPLPAGEHPHEGQRFTLLPAVGGSMSQAEYDDKVANLVAYMTYMADPSAQYRARLGVWVLSFLSLLFAACWWLNKQYWKDIR